MGKDKITQRVRTHIEDIEKILNLGKRIQFTKKDKNGYYTDDNWNTIDVKKVKSSVAYLYRLPTKSKKSIATLGFLFHFYDPKKYHTSEILPIEEQMLTISYSIEKIGDRESRKTTYSPKYSFSECKPILLKLKEIFTALKESKQIDFESIAKELDSFFLQFDHEDKDAVKLIENECTKEIKSIKSEKQRMYFACLDFKTTKETVKNEILASKEYEVVQKIKKELEKANEKLEKKGADIHKKHSLKEKERKAKELTYAWDKKAASFIELIKNTAIKLGIPLRFTDNFDEIVKIDKEKTKTY